jgi:hypothetical protein
MSVHSVEMDNMLTRFLSSLRLSLVLSTFASHRLVTWHHASSQGAHTGPWVHSGCIVMPHDSLLCGADCGWEAQGEEEILGTDPDVIEGEIEH